MIPIKEAFCGSSRSTKEKKNKCLYDFRFPFGNVVKATQETKAEFLASQYTAKYNTRLRGTVTSLFSKVFREERNQ